MNYFSKLFTKAPFDLLQLHMEKVIACVVKLDELLLDFHKGDLSRAEELATSISEYEHEADIIKNDIRASLPHSLFFTAPRSTFLDILSIQDDLSDTAEEIGGLLTIKPLVIPSALKESFLLFQKQNIDSVWDIKNIVFSFDELLEASFGGPVADKLKARIDQAVYKEHENDLMRRKLIKDLFALSGELSPPDFFLWVRLIELIGSMSHISEKLALRIGMLLDFQ